MNEAIATPDQNRDQTPPEVQTPEFQHPNAQSSETQQRHDGSPAQSKPGRRVGKSDLQRKARKALQQAQRAEQLAQRARDKYLKLQLDQLLQRDKGYLELQRQMEGARKKLTRQRVGRARKRDSIKASERHIRERHRQIEEHNRQEALCEADCQALEQTLQARRQEFCRTYMATRRLPV